jgi:protein involved in polysaccharide export with SLBB domain
LYDLYYDAGGALAGANFQGVSIERKITKETQENIEETADSLNLFFLEEEDNEIKIGIDFSEVLAKKGDHPDNVLLKSNDVITIPRFYNTISVLGEVQRETATPYEKGISLRNAVIKSGGLKQGSDYRNAYVVYQNGDVKGTKRFLFFNIRPKLEPGAIVVVPKKSEKNKMTLQESISVTTALASLTLIVRSLITN